MMTLDARSQQQIIELLSPLMASEQDRRSLLILAFVYHPLVQQIDFSGAVASFVPALVDRLAQFGKLDDGRPALWVLLEVAREQVGLDQKHRIDALRPAFELPPPPRLDRLFISYSRQNERYAQRIVGDLKDAGLRVWFDREKIKGGDEWWQSIVLGISNADYFLFCLSPDSIRSKTARDELLTARQQGKTIFAVMLEDCLDELAKEDFAEIAWLPKLHIIDFTQAAAYGDRLRELIQSLPGYTPPDSYFIEDYDPRDLPNPFRGLEAFLEVDAAYFFGREDVVKDLLSRLRDPQRPRLLAVVGASGSGKSSLVRAGLIPAMRQQFPFWETLTIKPGNHPLNDLADRLQERLGVEAERTRERLRATQSALDDIAAELLAGKPEEARFVLVIDQFEEIFTLTSDDERKAILDLLVFAIQHEGGRVQVIFTMRADFFDRLSAVPELAKLVRENLDIATEMTPEQLRRSIEEPARRVGVMYEEGLVETILEDVRAQPGSLPLLQYALKALFERKIGRQMKREAYETLGGVKGALATRAEGIYTALDAAQQEVLRRIFLRLIDVGEETVSRRRVVRNDLQLVGVADEIVQGVLDRLSDADSRMLVVSAPLDEASQTSAGQVFYEVSHEALMTHWERLATWISENRDDLRRGSEILSLAKAWENSEKTEAGYLLTGGRLIAGKEWIERSDVTALQRAFVEASVAFEAAEIERLERLTKEAKESQHAAESATQESQQSAKRARRARRIALGVGVIAVIVTIFAATFTTIRVNESQREARSAQNDVRNAETLVAAANGRVTEVAATLGSIRPTLTAAFSAVEDSQTNLEVLRLAGLSRQVLTSESGNSETGTLLAIRALNLYQSRFNDSQVDEQVLAVLQEALTNLNTLDSFLITCAETVQCGAAWSSDGQEIFVPNSLGSVDEIDLFTRSRTVRFEHGTDLYDIVASPVGDRLLTLGTDTIKLWDLTLGDLLFTSPTQAKHIGQNHLFSSDGSMFAIATGVLPDGIHNVVEIRDLTSLNIISTISVSLGTFQQGSAATDVGRINVDFSSDGAQILTNTLLGNVELWDVRVGQLIRAYPETANSIVSAFIHDSSEFITQQLSEDGIRVWDSVSGESMGQIASAQGASTSLSYNAQTDSLLVGGYVVGTNGQDQVASFSTSPLIINLSRNTIVGSLTGHAQPVLDVAFSPNGQYALTTSRDGTLRIWTMVNTAENLSSHSTGLIPLAEFNTVASPVRSAFSKDGRYVILFSVPFNVPSVLPTDVFGEPDYLSANDILTHVDLILYDLSEQRIVNQTRVIDNVPQGEMTSNSFLSFAVSPTLRYIVTRIYNEYVVFDVLLGNELYRWETEEYRQFRFASDDSTIIGITNEGRIEIIEFTNFERNFHTPTAQYISENGNYLIDYNMESIAVYDALLGQTIWSQPNELGNITRVTTSFSANTVAFFSREGILETWDMQTGTSLFRTQLTFDDPSRVSLALSGNGDILGVCGRFGELFLYDLRNNRELLNLNDTQQNQTDTFRCSTSRLPGIQLSDNDEYALIFVNDFFSPQSDVSINVSVVDLHTLPSGLSGINLPTFGAFSELGSVYFVPNRNFALVSYTFPAIGENAYITSTLSRWIFNTDGWIDYGCSRVFRDLTPEERSLYSIGDSEPTCPPRSSTSGSG